MASEEQSGHKKFRKGWLVFGGIIIALIPAGKKIVWFLSYFSTHGPGDPLCDRIGSFIWVFPIAVILWLVGLVLLIGVFGSLIPEKNKRLSDIVFYVVLGGYVLLTVIYDYFGSSFYWVDDFFYWLENLLN